MDGRLRRKGAAMFLTAVSGSMASFSEEFGKLIFNTMPGQFLSNKEVVYQAYVCAFFTAASQALQVILRWEIEVECHAGSGRLDLIIQHMVNKHGSIQQYKRVQPSVKDKGGDMATHNAPGSRRQHRRPWRSSTQGVIVGGSGTISLIHAKPRHRIASRMYCRPLQGVAKFPRLLSSLLCGLVQWRRMNGVNLMSMISSRSDGILLKGISISFIF
jgi:hypothetical protein